MKLVKVKEASDRQLEYLVAEIQGLVTEPSHLRTVPRYTLDCGRAGPIIFDNGISLTFFDDEDEDPWDAFMQMHPKIGTFESSNPLRAAMQCFVTYRVGEVAYVPEEIE